MKTLVIVSIVVVVLVLALVGVSLWFLMRKSMQSFSIISVGSAPAAANDGSYDLIVMVSGNATGLTSVTVSNLSMGANPNPLSTDPSAATIQSLIQGQTLSVKGAVGVENNTILALAYSGTALAGSTPVEYSATGTLQSA